MQNHNPPVNPKKLRWGYEETEVICCFAARASKKFGLQPNTKIFKCIKAEIADISILERVWKRDST